MHSHFTRGIRVGFVVCLAGTLVLGGVSLALGAGTKESSRPGLIVGGAQVQAGSERERRRVKRRDSAEAKQERRLSRTRCRDSGRGEAIALGRRFFPEGFAAALFDGEHLVPGLDLVGYRGTDTAIAKQSDGTRLLLQSTLPLRARTANGRLAPVDLSLLQSATTFTTANSSADLQISTDAHEGARLLSADIALGARDVDERGGNQDR
jgi:hypothetical protein